MYHTTGAAHPVKSGLGALLRDTEAFRLLPPSVHVTDGFGNGDENKPSKFLWAEVAAYQQDWRVQVVSGYKHPRPAKHSSTFFNLMNSSLHIPPFPTYSTRNDRNNCAVEKQRTWTFNRKIFLFCFFLVDTKQTPKPLNKQQKNSKGDKYYVTQWTNSKLRKSMG